jgi:hypothetical protein
MSNANEKSVLAQHRARLGKVPDQQIADLAGVSRTLVVNYRKKLGILPYQGHKAAPEPEPEPVAADASKSFRGRRSALDEFLDVLGKLPDADIAKMAGVTAENVRTYRNRRGIPATWQLAPAAERPTVAAPPTPVIEQAPAAPAAKRPGRAPRPAAEPPAVAESAALPAPAAEVEPVQAPVAAVADALPAVASVANTVFLVVIDTDQGVRNYAILGLDIAEAAAAPAARIGALHAGASIRSIQRVAELMPA